MAGWLKGIPYDDLSFEVSFMPTIAGLEDENTHISFSLGRFCAARAQIFHKLSHWNVGQHLVKSGLHD